MTVLCRHCGVDLEPCDCGSAVEHWQQTGCPGGVWCGARSYRRRHEPASDEDIAEESAIEIERAL